MYKKSTALFVILMFLSYGAGGAPQEEPGEQLNTLPSATTSLNEEGISDKNAIENQEIGTIDVEKIIKYSTKSSLEFTRRGMYYEENKDYKSALEDYSRALELTPNRSELIIRCAVCNEELKQYPEAIKDLTLVLGMRPYRAEIYNMRGKIYAKIGDDALAEWDFNKSVDLNPLKPEFYTDRGDFYESRDKTDLAKRDYYAAGELYAYTAKNFKEGKNWHNAIIEYDKALAKNPDNAEFKRLRKECADELAAELKAAEEAAAEEEAKKRPKKNKKLPKESLQS